MAPGPRDGVARKVENPSWARIPRKRDAPVKTRRQKMKLKEFIVNEAIVPQVHSSDRDGTLRELVTSLAQAGAIPNDIIDDLVAALIEREHRGSTGFGKGVAVPHVKHPKVPKMSGTVGRSSGGIDFAALDHQPVYTVVLLVSPASDTEPDK